MKDTFLFAGMIGLSMGILMLLVKPIKNFGYWVKDEQAPQLTPDKAESEKRKFLTLNIVAVIFILGGIGLMYLDRKL